MRLFKVDLRFLLFGFAVLIYGALSSPTPNNPGIVEALVGGCLLITGLLQGQVFLRNIKLQRSDWLKSACILLLYGVCVGLFVGFIFNNNVLNVIRDVLTFIFIFLPILVLSPYFHQKSAGQSYVLMLVLLGVFLQLDHFSKWLLFLVF